jgi:hypothetical protein
LTQRYVALLKRGKFQKALRIGRKFGKVRKATDNKARNLGVPACVSSKN